LAQKKHRRHCPAVIFCPYTPDQEGFSGNNKNRAIRGAVFNLPRFPIICRPISVKFPIKVILLRAGYCAAP